MGSGNLPSRKSRNLLGDERRREILESLERDGRVTIADLVARYQVSAVTARADLDILARSGALLRSHGGALRHAGTPGDYPLAFKQTLHPAEKERIAQAAAELIRPNQTIGLDSGTTTGAIARQIRIRKLRLTVITNALNVAVELCRSPQVSVVMLGGIVRPASLSMVGPHAEAILQSLRADHLFLGVDALDPEIGACTADIQEASLNSLMIKVSYEVTAVADSSKLRRRCQAVIGTVERLNRLITGKEADRSVVASIRSKGVEVRVV